MTKAEIVGFSLPMRDGNWVSRHSTLQEGRGFSLPMRDGNRPNDFVREVPALLVLAYL